MTLLSAQESGLPPPQPGSLSGAVVTTSYTTTVGGGGGTDTATSAAGWGTTLAFQMGATIPSSCPSSTTNSVNVGYYQSWAKYRQSHCHPQTASQIPVNAFGYTHLIYSFAGISTSGELEPYNGIMEEVTLYQEFNQLKGGHEGNGNGGLATLIAVGGWNLDQSLFSRISSTPATRQTFASSVVNFLIEYNFDGLDLDWEYPVSRQGSPEDYDNYPLLVQAIREALDQQQSSSGKEYLLTMAIPINPTKLDSGFNLRELSKHIDWFHLMSYDIHGSWDDIAGSNTDLEYISNTVENSILNQGVRPDQLVFGMASYGRSMKLTDPDGCTTVGCPISGAGLEGCSGEMGFSPLFELKEQYVDTGNYESLLLNERTGSMEMILEGGVFVSLDVEDTFLLKREYYLSKCFRGQMWWAIDMIKDPPFGSSTQVSVSTSNTNQQPGPTPSASSSTSLNAAPGVTQDDAYCADTTGAEMAANEDCSGFVFCQNGRMSGSITLCSPGLVFDANMGICNWPSETNLCGFEFCPKKRMTDGKVQDVDEYVSFEECAKFYYCKAGKVDGDIDICPDGTLFDVTMGICNWASMVVCDTAAPTPTPVHVATPHPTFGTVVTVSGPSVPDSVEVNNTPRPTYGTVAGDPFAANKDTTATLVPRDSVGLSTFQDNTARLRFTPTDDAYVQENLPYANYNDRFIVADQNERYDGLIRFYVQGLENRQVEYVKLRLYVMNQSRFGGNFYECNHNWHEDVVTWDLVPSIIGREPLTSVNAVLLDDWIEVDVTGLVTEDGPVSLRITSDSSDNVMYSSKENDNGNAPELIVGVVPAAADPTTTGAIEARDAPTVTNTFKIGPTDDAFVVRTAFLANQNYGQHEDLKVDMGTGYKKSFLRFDLSRVHFDAVKQVVLRLYATESSRSGGTFVTVTDSNWNEDTITYDNAPPADGIPLGMLENVNAGNWYELDITSAISESRPLTICIMGNHEDDVMYSSKDGSHSPEIALTLQEFVPLSSQGGQVMELVATDDATIVLQAPDSNFGTKDELKTDARDGMHNFLLRFDATAVPRGQVKSAILRIYAMNKEPAFGGTFIENRKTDWDERTVTWNNAPSSDGRVMGSLMEVEYGSWYDMDVTSAVIGGSAVSFRVSSPHFNEAIYGSKEGDYKPRLIVQYSPSDPLPDDMDVYIPTDDASILMERPDESFGRNEELKVDGYGGVYNSLLRFDLSAVEKGSVKQAILRLYAVDGSPSGGTFVLTQNTDWSQHKVTWNTAPAADGVILETLGEVIPYQWYEIDLAKVATNLGGEPLSIRIAPSHGLRCAYSSSRDRLGHLPQLLIKADMFQGMG